MVWLENEKCFLPILFVRWDNAIIGVMAKFYFRSETKIEILLLNGFVLIIMQTGQEKQLFIWWNCNLPDQL